VQYHFRNKELYTVYVWEVALELWALTHGYVALYRAGRFNLSEKEFRAHVRRALRRLIHGFKA
jgi:hypothetical protein